MQRGKIEFLVFSDLHLHEYSNYSEDNTNFSLSNVNNYIKFTNINSRLCYTAQMLEHIRKYAAINNIENILFCGDFLHTKKSATKDVFNIMVNWVRACDSSEINLILIPGNHDYSNKEGNSHSLLAIKDFDNVIVLDSKHSCTPIGQRGRKNYTCVFGIPYTEDKEVFNTAFNNAHTNNLDYDYYVTLCHTGIQGAKVGSSYVITKDHDVDISTLACNKYTACFFGHYHEHQKVFPNGWVVGAPTEHDWGDVGGIRGFLHVTLDDGLVDVKHIPTPREIPRFKLLNDESSLEDIKPWDFIKFETTESITEEHKNNIEGMIAAACGGKPKWLEIVPTVKNENKEEFVLSSKATSSETVLDEWVNCGNIPSLNREKVLQIGKEILSEAKESLL